jgi:hypothetical protein
VLRRMLIAFVVFIIAIVVVADRVGEKVAAHVLADKLQTDEQLPSKPSTSISGFPFLTQAIGGKYKEVSVTAHDFVTDGVRVSTMTVHLHGVHLPISKVIGGSVHQVPIDHVDGSATVSFAEMKRYLGTHGVEVTFSRGPGGSLKVRDSVTLHGQKVTVTEAVGLSVTGNVITLTLSGATLPVGSVLAIPLQGLPFRVSLHSVTVTTDGVSATGTADHVVLGS